jgi:hypothetical protein
MLKHVKKYQVHTDLCLTTNNFTPTKDFLPYQNQLRSVLAFEADATGIGIRAPGSAIRYESTPVPDQHVKKFELLMYMRSKRKLYRHKSKELDILKLGGETRPKTYKS